MSDRRPRIPPTRRTLYLLPAIDDDLTPEQKNATALRNACATGGVCPSATGGVCPACGVAGELYRDRAATNVFHYVFTHEDWCPAGTDEAA